MMFVIGWTRDTCLFSTSRRRLDLPLYLEFQASTADDEEEESPIMVDSRMISRNCTDREIDVIMPLLLSYLM